MSGSSEPELLQRLVDFQLELQRDSSEQVEEFDLQPGDRRHVV